jgi:hypothetical protein
MNCSESDTLTGKVSYRTSDAFSFAVLDSADTAVLQKDIAAKDGAWDEETEPFFITLGKDFPQGEYKLKLYPGPKERVCRPRRRRQDWFCHGYRTNVKYGIPMPLASV